LDCFNPSKKKIQNNIGKENIIADVGSGNGVPGLIWAICDKNLNIVLIEKIAKKIAFLNHVIGVLQLGNRVTTIKDDVKNIKSRQFDIITSRAFSNCENFLKSTKSISKEDSLWMLMTTSSRSSQLTEGILKRLKVEITDKSAVMFENKKTSKQIIYLKSSK
jgi:16S rRNA (guanine(527)-N(7))-methyltransferase RsmG